MSAEKLVITATLIVTHALLAVAVHALIRWYAPIRDSDVSPSRIASLRLKYSGHEMAAVLPFLLVAGVITWVTFRGLLVASEWWLTRVRTEAAEFIVLPEGGAFFGLGLMIGMLLGALVVSVAARVLMGRTRYEEWCLASRYGQGFDANRVAALLAGLVLPAGVWLSVLEADKYVYVTRSEFVDNPFWGFAEDRRRLSDVTAVYAVDATFAADGKQARPPHFMVRFRDGSEWTTRDGGRFPRPALDRPLVEYIAAQAEVPVRAVGTAPPPG